jgi:hypothetical protein
MGEIKIEHNGHTITYSENEDVWRCWALEAEAKTLSILKTKINKIDAEARRVDVKVFEIDRLSKEQKIVKCLMVDADGKSVWILEEGKTKFRGEDVKGRRKKTLVTSIAEVTPENRALIGAYHQAVADEDKARRRTAAALEAIPRLTVDRLRELGASQEPRT